MWWSALVAQKMGRESTTYQETTRGTTRKTTAQPWTHTCGRTTAVVLVQVQGTATRSMHVPTPILTHTMCSSWPCLSVLGDPSRAPGQRYPGTAGECDEPDEPAAGLPVDPKCLIMPVSDATLE